MSYAERHAVTVTTDASGDGVGYTPVLTGWITNVIYTKGNYDNGVDIDVTGDVSGLTIWSEDDVNASKTVAPRQATHSTAGVASLYASGGTAVTGPIYVAKERVKIQVAQGGNAKSGTFTVIVA